MIGPYGTQQTTWGGFDNTGYTKDLTSYQADQQAANAARNAINSGGLSPDQIAVQTGLISKANRAAPDQNSPLYRSDPDTPIIHQTLSPEQQSLYDQQVATQQKLGGVAGQGADALKGVVGTPVDFSGAPQTGNYDATRKSVIDAMMGRANEDYAKQSDASNSNLIAAGIRPGTKAYGDQQQMIERSRNDARQQAEIAGGNAASQAYGIDEARRRQAITEMLAQRQTPINEISALMSGSQVSNPFSTPGYAQNAQVQPAPTFGAAQQAGQYGTDVYNAQMAGAGNTQSGLFGLGGAGLMGLAAFY